MAREKHPSAPGALSLEQLIRHCGIVVESAVEVDRESLPSAQRMDVIFGMPDERCWDVALRADAPGEGVRRASQQVWSPEPPTVESVIKPAVHLARLVAPGRSLQQFWCERIGAAGEPFDQLRAADLHQLYRRSIVWLQELIGQQALDLAARHVAASDGTGAATGSHAAGGRVPRGAVRRSCPPGYPVRIEVTPATLRTWCEVEAKVYAASNRPEDHRAYLLLRRLATRLRIDDPDEAQCLFESALRAARAPRLHPWTKLAILDRADQIWRQCQLSITPPWRSTPSAFGRVRDDRPDLSEVGDDTPLQ
jgi:hypothetical protein